MVANTLGAAPHLGPILVIGDVARVVDLVLGVPMSSTKTKRTFCVGGH